ncbi:MAG TPA: c-type cytochrome [Steroidobacteraceae bacterium]|jgi:cytochrome c553
MKLSQLIALSFATLPFIGGLAHAADAAAEKADPALQNTVQTCAACHGASGRSVAPTFPNLAAQTAPYLEAQLKAFKDQTRGDPDAQAYMWGMAAPLSEAMITELAAYYAKQTPAKGTGGDTALIARGKEVFEKGIPAAQIPACATCHGAHAQGMASFPRLAGQHAPYLLKQLLVIQSALRNAPVMHGVVKELTRDQMLAVTAYLESI